MSSAIYSLDQSATAAAVAVPAETLVIYTYSKSDPEYERNLEYFVAHGMWEGDGCQYLIIVQQVWPVCPFLETMTWPEHI